MQALFFPTFPVTGFQQVWAFLVDQLRCPEGVALYSK